MNEREKMILVELQTQHEEALRAWDSLDNKLVSIFIAAGFIFALFVALKPATGLWGWVQFAAYLIMLALTLVGLWPRTTRSPIRLDWETIWKEYLSESDENAYKQLVSDYLYALSANNRLGHFKSRVLMVSMILLTIQVSAVLITLAVALAAKAW
ncbi:MAG TPA: hypothetical protein VMW24_24850 [Sedimentisphaerales bacterium]|nr:hypothetical protein [Sedimentisphaerales bacterium]